MVYKAQILGINVYINIRLSKVDCVTYPLDILSRVGQSLWRGIRSFIYLPWVITRIKKDTSFKEFFFFYTTKIYLIEKLILSVSLCSGIFAYVNYLTPKSRKEILELLVGGLKRLEYRGYDSAGKNESSIEIVIENLSLGNDIGKNTEEVAF